MTTHRFQLPGASGFTIRGHLHVHEAHEKRSPVLVFMHGFKGFQDWGPWASICDRFAEHGVAALRFDLSHNGVGDDGVAFSALDRFERNTIDAELFDLSAVLDWLDEGGPGLPEAVRVRLDVGRTVLLGHSRGGGGVLLGAAERLGLSPTFRTAEREERAASGDPAVGGERAASGDRAATASTAAWGGSGRAGVALRGLVTWSAIATWERGWAAQAVERWERGESVPVWNKRTAQMMPLGPQLYRDYLARPERYDIQAAAGRLGRIDLPLLLLHGAEDETVPVEEADLLAAAYRKGGAGARRVEVVRIPGGDHTFGTKHPFDGWTAPLEAVFGHTLRFVRQVTGMEEAR